MPQTKAITSPEVFLSPWGGPACQLGKGLAGPGPARAGYKGSCKVPMGTDLSVPQGFLTHACVSGPGHFKEAMP